MGARVSIIGAGPGTPDQLTSRARRALERSDRVYLAGGVAPAALVRAAERVEPDVLADDGDGALPASLLESARGGRWVTWVLAADPSERDWRAALASCAAEALELEVVPAAHGVTVVAGMPLSGVRVLVTRAVHQAAELCELLEQRGAVPLCLPTIAVVPPAAPQLLDDAVARLGHEGAGYDFLVLTSANGVPPMRGALERAGLDARALAGVTVCAIGPGTARALGQIGLSADVVAEDFRAEGLLEALGEQRVRGRRVLLPRAEVAREILPETLRERGATVDLVPAYRTVRPPQAQTAIGLQALREGQVDVLTFTSASTVNNFVELVGDDAPRLCAAAVVCVIGPVTGEAAQRSGIRVDVMPTAYTLPDMIAALEACGGRRAG